MHLPLTLSLMLLSGSAAVLAKCTNETFTSILSDHPEATLTRVEAVPEGGSFGEGNFTFADGLPELCVVSVNVQSSENSSYNFGLFLPETSWNERFMMTGNGGLGGFINWFDMAVLTHYGFAALSTDTGHISEAEDGSWADHAPESIIDWGYRAVHGSVVLGKDIINKYYASTDGIQYSYWSGCSTGGRQGLKEIQTHPDSFDGIAIGAPTWWITHISAGQLRRGLLNLPESDVKHIAPELFPVITKEMESQCDPQDGLSDGIISDPLGCDFDFEALLCKGSNSSDCLVEEQLDTLKKVYTDWHEDDTLVWSGSTLGTPPSVLQNASWAIGLDFFRYFVQNDSSWELTEFTYADLQLADDINPGDAIAGDFDLSAFKERGGKVLLYHGEADDAIPPGDSIYFREQVQETLGENIDDFYRVFLIPGMGHCASSTLAPWYVGGAGHAFALGSTQPVPELKDPEHDVMLAVTQWVEENKAPEKLIATKFANDTLEGGVMGQRPVCVYPRKARYLEGEDPDEAGSWECE